jgi:hypothetical protein
MDNAWETLTNTDNSEIHTFILQKFEVNTTLLSPEQKRTEYKERQINQGEKLFKFLVPHLKELKRIHLKELNKLPSIASVATLSCFGDVSSNKEFTITDKFIFSKRPAASSSDIPVSSSSSTNPSSPKLSSTIPSKRSSSSPTVLSKSLRSKPKSKELSEDSSEDGTTLSSTILPKSSELRPWSTPTESSEDLAENYGQSLKESGKKPKKKTGKKMSKKKTYASIHSKILTFCTKKDSGNLTKEDLQRYSSFKLDIELDSKLSLLEMVSYVCELLDIKPL